MGQTSQLAEMRDWYCTVLDAHVVFEGHGLCFMTFDDEHHRIALLGSPVPLERKSPTTAAVHHTAYTFDSLDDLLERCAALKEKGRAEGPDPARHHDLAVLPGPRRQLRRAAGRQLRHAGRGHGLHARSRVRRGPGRSVRSNPS
ncbi:VOC family protein [Streptomyces sp. T028]|uniref:VOC family protein n=1 Tax=Streptomyces sp. T028 TaxID=3394379 RepID=UPI003A8C7755